MTEHVASSQVQNLRVVIVVLMLTVVMAVIYSYQVGVKAEKCRAAGGNWTFISSGDNCVSPVKVEP